MAREQSPSSRSAGMVPGGMTHDQAVETPGVSRHTFAARCPVTKADSLKQEKLQQGELSQLGSQNRHDQVCTEERSSGKAVDDQRSSNLQVDYTPLSDDISEAQAYHDRSQPKLMVSPRRRLKFAMARRSWAVED